MLRFPIINGFSSSLSFPFGALTPLSVAAGACVWVCAGFLSSSGNANRVVGDTINAERPSTIARFRNVVFILNSYCKLVDVRATGLLLALDYHSGLDAESP